MKQKFYSVKTSLSPTELKRKRIRSYFPADIPFKTNFTVHLNVFLNAIAI